MPGSKTQRAFQWLHRHARRSKAYARFRRLFYDIRNSDDFSNLYEHEKMLADTTRVEAYAAAIARHVRPGDVVVDLGTGTGLLALLASRQTPRAVIAVEHTPMVELAREIAARNGGTGIRFVHAHSSTLELTPDEGQADLILHEQMGDLLFNENMVANLLDLKARLLKPGGRILPARFEIFLEPVRLKEAHRVPFLWEIKAAGLDLAFLKEHPALEDFKRRDYRYRWLDSDAVEAFLCQPSPILRLDLDTMRSETDLPRTLTATSTVRAPGRLDGLCFYFRTIFDEDIHFDTSPMGQPGPGGTCTNWGRRFFRLPARHCEAGQQLTCRLNMPDLLQINTWAATLED